MTEQEIEEKFEKRKGYSQVLFDNEEFSEMYAYIEGYKQALEDFKEDLENLNKYKQLTK